RFSNLLTVAQSSRLCPLSLHDALPILRKIQLDLVCAGLGAIGLHDLADQRLQVHLVKIQPQPTGLDAADIQQVVDQRLEAVGLRSEEHTSELQSRENLVCRLLLEKKKQ